MFKKSFVIFLMLFLCLISVGMVFASENMTDINDDVTLTEEISVDETAAVELDKTVADESHNISTNIKTKDVDSYYKEKTNFVSYLKDDNNQAISNKTLKVQIGDKVYNTVTDKNGKITVPVNLKPNNYKVRISFDGDDDYAPSSAKANIKIKKAPLAIKMSNFNTYAKSDLFFNVKVYNTVTKNAVRGIKVKFNVYNTKTKKSANFWATTGKDGVARLKKSFDAGTYKVSTKINDSKNKKYISYKNSNSRVTLKVKSSSGEDCCAFFVQVSNNEGVAGFRRDGTGSTLIQIKSIKLGGKSAVKQCKVGFFHLMASADGWMMGNGGIDGGAAAIEKLAGEMVKSNKIQYSILKKIKRYKSEVHFGHFSIKAPDGRFAVVWHNGYISGKLKPGEYICCPNFKSYYRHGTYDKFSIDPAKAAVKIGATDKYGVNRRNIIVYHWKTATDKNFKVSSSIKIYAANDNGRLVGLSTSHLKDSISFKNKITSKNSLPKSPNMKYIGTHKFGNIDKLVKVPTTIKAPKVTNKFNNTNYFNVTVKNKNTGKAVVHLNIKIKVSDGINTKVYTIKTDNNGVAKFDTKNLAIGSYNVVLAPATSKYVVSGNSKIVIAE